MTFTWDGKSLRFRGAQGRFVKRSAITDALERGRDEAKKRVEKLTIDLKEGRINIPQFQISMRDEIKSQHLLSAGIARGGKANLSPAELGRIGALTREQYKRLNNYARQVSTRGKQPSVGRSKMYVDSARGTFSEVERRMQDEGGVNEYEANVLHAKESCEGCLAESAKGRVPIGTLSKIGSRICLSNCACSIEYSRAA